MSRATLVQALVYAIAAFAAARLILGPSQCYGALGCDSPYPLGVLSAAAAVCGYVLLVRFGWLARLGHPMARGVVRGISVALVSHLLLGPLALIPGLASPGGLQFETQTLANVFASFMYVFVVGQITLPLGALAGAINEVIAKKVG